MSSQNFIPTLLVVKRKKATEMHRKEETVELVDEGMREKEHPRVMTPRSDCQQLRGRGRGYEFRESVNADVSLLMAEMSASESGRTGMSVTYVEQRTRETWDSHLRQ